MHTARQELLSDVRWTERTPHLLMDRMQDLYGGAEGGHLLADFRVNSEGPARWLSYYHNNRGALMEGETTSWYRAVRRLTRHCRDRIILSSASISTNGGSVSPACP